MNVIICNFVLNASFYSTLSFYYLMLLLVKLSIQTILVTYANMTFLFYTATA